MQQTPTCRRVVEISTLLICGSETAVALLRLRLQWARYGVESEQRVRQIGVLKRAEFDPTFIAGVLGAVFLTAGLMKLSRLKDELAVSSMTLAEQFFSRSVIKMIGSWRSWLPSG